MTPPRLFITGTDTGVGKTRVACALLTAWRQRGLAVAAMKPVETGCAERNGQLWPEDAAALQAAAARGADLDLICPFRYPAPASPETAAHLAHLPPPDLRSITQALERISHQAALTLIEGAGGLLVPLSPDLLTIDLVQHLGATLLIVARTALGTLNHTLLTLEAARHRGLPLAGVLLNQPTPPAGPEESRVADLLAHHGRVRIFGTLPHAPILPPPSALAQIAEQHLDLDALWQAVTAKES
ncbi:MAG TPA: dethiobiotin synthase [Polyangia bacterium]|jgi:dethiobiotin synthetase|nr:dethiobiotin synthase [Polyangia bacterium]